MRVSSVFVDLNLESTLVSELFIIYSNWLVLGGAVPPESARPQR